MIAFIFASLLTATLISAHGGIINPSPIDPIPAGQRPSLRNFHTVRGSCDAAIPNTAAAVNLTPGSTFTMTYFILNGDGAGPLSAQLDTTGTGRNFQTNVQNPVGFGSCIKVNIGAGAAGGVGAAGGRAGGAVAKRGEPAKGASTRNGSQQRQAGGQRQQTGQRVAGPRR